ncbi:tRNA nucleotidyltransferase [Pseudoflavonifractor sp. An85]|uniref:CCA tRNA nucleotidyltransferase n=1 Tax=Pseudoflavonifractor sp. An85 TaxID=1965661 RepID=UPI0013025B56|nr:tRNA nucleotidyltransferase [Pseudoflavonifractor sp. An85]
MDCTTFLPSAVRRCCQRLHQAGFEGYPVGGCVRDLLLGRTPQDWDVCTSALPHQVQALFPHTVPTGLAYGTITVVEDGFPVEVTTYRQETAYHDGRRPDAVAFVSSLEQDLSRRDFTINAMALTLDGHILDPFGGQADLQARRVRCVGEPKQRFTEDRLRLFRAIRFGAQLDFHLEEQLLHALLELGAQPHTLPPERIRPEVEKTLCASAPRWTGLLFSSGLLSTFLPKRLDLDTSVLSALPSTPLARWAGLVTLLRQEGADPLPLLRGLIPDRTLIGPLTQALPLEFPLDARGWRHLLSRHGEATCQALAAMSLRPQPLQALEDVLAQAPCISPKQLALSGKDLMALGLSGPNIGRAQKMLLEHVLNHPEDNTAPVLRRLLSQT